MKWEQVPECNRSGIITNYFVKVFNSNKTELDDKLSNVTGSKYSVVIDGLQEYTNYSVKVFAATAKGGGPSSEYITTTTHRKGSYKKKLKRKHFFHCASVEHKFTLLRGAEDKTMALKSEI